MFCVLRRVTGVDGGQVATMETFFEDAASRLDAAKSSANDRVDNESDTDNEDATERKAGVEQWMEAMDDTDSRAGDAVTADGPRKATWLKNTLVAASSNLDVVAVAHANRVVVLERSTPDKDRLMVVGRIETTFGMRESDFITAVVVLSVASQQKSDVSPVGWTCIVIAFNTGVVHFYTERGMLLFYEKVAHGFIASMRFGPSLMNGGQELTILARNRLTIIGGASLASVLRQARVALANGEQLTEIAERLQLEARAVRLDDLTGVFDFVPTGAEQPTFFDQMITASMAPESRDVRFKPAMPEYATYLVLSRSTFVSFVWHDFSDTHLTPADYVAAVASSLTSYVPSFGVRSFFGLGKSRKDRPQKVRAADVRLEMAQVRSSLVYPEREGERVFVAPRAWRLVAVADHLARVLIIDVTTRTIIRRFTGYRNARCAFVESWGHREGTQKGSRLVRALFLAIYAPKRGLIELWAMRSGPLVSTWRNLDTNGRLLSLPAGSEATLGTPSNEHARQAHSDHGGASAVFIDSHGSFFTISAPFHLAFQGPNDTSVHDENLLRHFKALASAEFVAEKFVHFVSQFKTVEYQRKCLSNALKTLHVPLPVLVKAIGQLTSSDASQTVYLANLKAALSLYDLLSTAGPSEVLDGSDALQTALGLADIEAEHLGLDLLIRADSAVGQAQTARLSPFPVLDVFVSSFDLTKETGLRLDLAGSDAAAVASTFFGPCLLGDRDATTLLDQYLPAAGLTAAEGARLLVSFWISRDNSRPTWATERLVRMIQAFGTNVFSPEFIASVEGELATTENVRAALLFYLAYLAVKRGKNKSQVKVEVDPDAESMETTPFISDADDDHWEQMDEFTENVDLLSRHLALLSLISVLPSAGPVTLDRLLSKGAAYYREQVGVWSAITKQSVSAMRTLGDFEGGDALARLRFQLPSTLAFAQVATDCCWEAASAWFRDSSRRVTLLSQAMAFFEAVGDPRLQQGLGLMLWDTFIQTPFRKLCSRLDSQNGKLPSDREARADQLVTEPDLFAFVDCVTRLLAVICTATADIDVEAYAPPESEDIVARLDAYSQAHRHTKPPVSALCDIAARKKQVNFHLVKHHLLLAKLVKLRILCSIPLSPAVLYDGSSQRAFWEPLHSHPLIPADRVEPALRGKRQRFLEQCVEKISDHPDADRNAQWSIVLDLAEAWALNVDALRIKETVVFYEQGLDSEAEKLFVSVEDRFLLAVNLFDVVFARVKHAFAERPELMQTAARRSLASPSLLGALRTEPFPELVVDVEPRSTAHLIRILQNLFATLQPSKVGARVVTLKELDKLNDLLVRQVATGE